MATAISGARGGSGMSDALKAVETLFETQTVVEIREVETKTRTDIEDKQKQLRLLVGNSYRDLISSADTILEMAQTCDSVVQNIVGLQDGLKQLADSRREGQDQNLKGQEVSKRRHLHAVGGRIKYLVDTPEVIWGCLDTHEALAAARRLLCAQRVYEQLQRHASADLAARFPLVNRQWPAILKFRHHIQQRLEQRLNQHEAIGAAEFAVCLAAAACLDESLDSKKALQMFLDSRLQKLKAILQAGLTSFVDHETDAASTMTEAVELLQESVWQAGRLFLQHASSDNPALLPTTLEEEGFGNELLFGPIEDGAASDATPEAETWKAANEAIQGRMKPLSQQEAAAALLRFLEASAEVFGGKGLEFIARCCRSAADVASLEGALRAGIKAWQHEEPESREDGMLSPTHAAAPTTPRPGTPLARPEPTSGLPSAWEPTCEWVLAKRTSLWDVILEPTFVRVGKQLIRTALETVEADARGGTDECQKMAEKAAVAPAGSYQSSTWPEASLPDEMPGRKRPRFDETFGAVPSGAAAATTTWRERLPKVRADFDAGLQSLLADTLLLLADQAASREPPLQRAFSRRSFPLPPAASQGRAAALQPFLQDEAAAMAGRLRDHLASQLESILRLSQNASLGDTDIEQALLLARMCLALGASDTLLAAILGPPEGWKDAAVHGIGSAQAKPGSRAAKSRFPGLQESFRAAAAQGFGLWAEWANALPGKQLRNSLAGDPALLSATPLWSWEETVIAQEGEEAGEETRFLLPAIPSPGVMIFLLAGGREFQRAGGALHGSAALGLLKQGMAAAALDAFREALAPGTQLSQGVTEKGILQLLFDLRLLRDVTSSASSGSHKRPVDEATKGFADLETILQDKLDPIDWAIYGSYLWQNEAAFLQRVRALFGSLLLTSALPKEATTKATASAEANILQFAPTASRFAYLPITTPSATASGLRQLPSAGLARASEEQRQSHDYSFAHFGGMKTGSNLEQEAESAASTAFEALQSRFTSQRLGALGTLLGDRAAEVTAMAQQSFSDMSLPTAFTSALGTSGGGATGLLASFRGFRAGATE